MQKSFLFRWCLTAAVAILVAAGTAIFLLNRADLGDPPLRRVLGRPAGRVPVTSISLPVDNPGRLPVHAIPVFPKLGVQGLTCISPVPGNGDALFALGKAGRLFQFSRSDGGAQRKVLLDLSARVDTVQNGGVLGLAFDPKFETNRRFYLHWTTPKPNRIMISRYALKAGDGFELDPNATEVLLEIPVAKFSHVGGTVAFGPDDMLYISTGYGDDETQSQNPGSLLGKILRIDPSGGSPYAVPDDNPFVGKAGARPEIWALGLRNPWRFSFDPGNGDLWLGDIGSKYFEEVNLVKRAGNYGWNAFEATMRRDEEEVGTPPADAIDPVVQIPPELGQAVIGGHVYRGADMPSMNGRYFYGDYITGRLWALEYDGEKVISNREVGFVSGLSSFFEDHDGELYAVAFGGEVYRLREPIKKSTASFPALLSQTGVFKDTAAMVPADGMIEYEVASALWSDGAEKRRWIALPGGETIDFQERGAWEFPLGTVIVKHFDMELSPEEWQRIETRLMVHEESGWGFYTYRWNAEETDAKLVTDPGRIELVSTKSKKYNREYHLPSASECMVCHTPVSGVVLGIHTNQLNTSITYAEGAVNQLDEWDRLGMFDRRIGPASQYDAMVDPWDATKPLHERVRSYLGGNCAHCHQPGGPTRSTADMRYHIALAEAGMVGAPTFSGSSTRRIVKPGEPTKSDLYRRIETTGDRAMPPVGRLHADPFAEDLIRRWIKKDARDS